MFVPNALQLEGKELGRSRGPFLLPGPGWRDTRLGDRVPALRDGAQPESSCVDNWAVSSAVQNSFRGFAALWANVGGWVQTARVGENRFSEMSTKSEALTRIQGALAEFEALAADEAGLAVGVPFSDCTDADLLESAARLGRVLSVVQANLTEVAAEIGHRSHHSNGRLALCKREGFATPTHLLADITGQHPASVARMVRVGDAVYQGRALDGGVREARHPFVAKALRADTLSVDAADVIAGALDRAARGGSLAEHRAMESLLVGKASVHPISELRILCEKATDVLHPDGSKPRHDMQRRARTLSIRECEDGMTKLTALLPPEDAAIVRAGIFAVARAVDAAPAVEPTHIFMGHTSNANEVPDGGTPDGASYDVYGRPVGETAITWGQKLADALVTVFRHGASCTATGVKSLPAFHVVVRIALNDLLSGTGVGEVDGGGTLDAGHVRRIAASAGIIPAVLGSDSMPLDVGRSQRFFNFTQRTALRERDGSCAWPGCLNMFSDAHHIRWWEHDTGPSDISNGVMLCPSHHHRIHDNGWTIEIRPPDSDPNGPPTPHFVAPATSVGAALIPGAVMDERGKVTLRGGRTTLTPTAA